MILKEEWKPKNLLLDFDFSNRNNLFKQPIQISTTDELNMKMKEYFSKTKQELNNKCRENENFVQELGSFLSEILTNIKTENYKNGLVLENCIKSLLFVTKNIILDHFNFFDIKIEELTNKITFSEEKLITSKKDFQSKIDLMDKKMRKIEESLKIERTINSKLSLQVIDYNNYHFEISEKIKALTFISSRLRDINEGVNKFIQKLENNTPGWIVDHQLAEMYSLHSSSGRIIAIIEQFKLENNVNEIEMSHKKRLYANRQTRK